jgi:hypothetical protein
VGDSKAVPDGPEADMQEQRQEVSRGTGGPIDPAAVRAGLEVPEADALEQAQEVPLADDDDID